MKKLFAVVMLFSFLGMVALPVVVSAQPGIGEVSSTKIPDDINTPDKLIAAIRNVTDWVFVILLVVASIFIIIAALQFVTAGGKPESVTEARQKLIWAVVGIVIALFARAIPDVIVAIVGAGGG